MYVTVNIFAVYMIRYGTICKDLNGRRWPIFLPVCALLLHQTAAHAHIRRPGKANNASCIYHAVNICAYLCICVYICAYLCLSDSI